MRRVLGPATALLLAAVALPAGAADEPVLNGACEVAPGTVVLSPGTPHTGTIPTPSFLVGNEEETVAFVVSLAGLPVGTTARVDAAITWGVAANDYDLHVVGGETDVTTEGYQPFEPAEEAAAAEGVEHCGDVTIGAVDFLAPVVADTVRLTLGTAKA